MGVGSPFNKQNMNIIPENYITRLIDEANDDLTYIGYSKAGKLINNSKWVVKKIEKTGSVTTITHAVGSWASRATLNYD